MSRIKKSITCVLVVLAVLCLMFISKLRVNNSEILFSLKDNYTVENIDLHSVDNIFFSDVNKVFEYDDYTLYAASIEYRGKFENAIKSLNNTGMFSEIEYDSHMYSDAFGSGAQLDFIKEQWYIEETGVSKIRENGINNPGSDIVVAVIDTGVDYSHEDLKDNMWINDEEYFGRRGVDDDKNGYVDDIYGVNVINKTGNTMDGDETGHGTHVAGIIAMTDNRAGGIGVASGAKIMSVRAGDSKGSFKMSDVVLAVEYALNNGAHIINMSFGAYGKSDVLEAVLKKASEKCVLVAAAGNSGHPNTESSETGAEDAYPAAFPFVIGVMAHDNKGELAPWSNYDVRPFSDIEYEISAPGSNILSTLPGNKYGYMNGTSMAAPVVSGTAAILYSQILADSEKRNMDDIPGYIFGQLTGSAKGQVVKNTVTGEKISYPKVNVYDALTTTPVADVRVGNAQLQIQGASNHFNDECTYEIDKTQNSIATEIRCGFVLKNIWADARDIEVIASSDSANITFGNNTLKRSAMKGLSYEVIDCGAQDAIRFNFTGEKNNTYNVKINFKVNYKSADENEVELSNLEEFSFIIKLVEKQMVVEPTPVVLRYVTVKPEIISTTNNIKIKWNGIPDAKVYQIYRSIKKNSGYKLLNIISADKKTVYKDKSAKYGVKYYYKIKVGYDDGSVSTGKEVAVSGIRLKKVAGFKKKNTSKAKELSWNKVKGADGYEIYYSNKKNGKYKKLKTISKKKFSHKSEKKYFYKIRAYAKTTEGKVYGKYSKVK